MTDDDPVSRPLLTLIEAWCDRRDLKHLALLLPAFTANNGLTDGWGDVMEALRCVRATRGLPQAEQAEIDRLLPRVERLVHRT